MKHLLGVDSSRARRWTASSTGPQSFAEVGRRDIKKVPTLRGRTIVNLFYEASTRTLSSFELAAKRLSADVVSVKSAGSSVDKGESLKDTVATLSAYDPAAIVIRSPHVGAAGLVARWTEASVINAGDGKHEHPTQALLDVFTLRQRLDSLEGTNIWIVGDVLHSRVARSCLLAFQKMGAKVTLCGPPTLIPRGIEALGCEVSYVLDGLGEADVVYALRMQRERMSESFVPSLREYATRYQIDSRRLGPRQLLMHPGPVNRGVELSPEVIDSPQSLITAQVESGLVVRMAILYELLAGAATGPGPTAGPLRPTPRRSDSRRERSSISRRRLKPRRTWSSGALACSTRGPASTALTTWWCATARSRRSLTPGTPRRSTAPRSSTARACSLCPPSSTRTSTSRVPGQEHKEDLETGTRSAAAGGYCAVIAMANTSPPIDSAAVLGSVRNRAEREASIPVGFVANVTRGMEGRELTEMAELAEAGAIGFSDDGLPIANARVLRRALQYQRLAGGVIALHEEDPDLSADGVMNEGEVSAALGMAGVPAVSESTMIARNCSLALYEGARIHVQHLSARASVEEIARAKASGVQVTCEASPHHLTAHRRGRPQPRRALQDEPAPADRGRSPGSDRGAPRRHDRLRRDGPRPARFRGEGGSLRGGGDGGYRASRPPSPLSTPTWCCRESCPWNCSSSG